MTLWDREVGAGVRAEGSICEQQNGFMPTKNTTEAVFAVRMLTEKQREVSHMLRLCLGWTRMERIRSEII